MKETTFCAGAGRAEIEFPQGYFPVEGYAALHDPLHARALLIQRDISLLLVSLELPSVRPFSLLDGMRDRLSALSGVPAERIWITVTHSLSAPHVPQINEERCEPDAERKHAMHLHAVTDAMERAVRQAMGTLRPAAVGMQAGNSNVICNRNIPTADGWWVGLSGVGPSDKTLFVIKLETLDGQPLALLFNYALKSCVLEGAVMSDGKKYASADLCGAACAFIERQTQVPALFFMGAAGDQVPVKMAHYLDTDCEGRLFPVDLRERGYDFLEELGAQLGGDVLKTAQGIVCTPEVQVLQHGGMDLRVPGQVRYPKHLPPPPVLGYEYLPAEDQTIHVEAIRIGRDVIVGVKPEIPTLTNMLLKRRSPFRHTLLFSMVNGGQDYIPEDLDYERFEYPALHATVAKGSDKLFLDAVIGWLEQLQSQG